MIGRISMTLRAYALALHAYTLLILCSIVPVIIKPHRINRLTGTKSFCSSLFHLFHWYGGPGKQKAPAGDASAGLGWLLLVSPG